MLINSKYFKYIANQKLFSAFASDIPNIQFEQKTDGKLGFTMVSDRTGVTIDYSLVEQLITNGDLMAWEFAPTAGSIQKAALCKGTRVVVFNT